MIAHLLLVRPIDPLSDDDRTELESVLGALGGISGVENFSFGPDFSGRGRGYAYAAVMYFTERAALQGYMTDPEHLRIVDALNRLAPERLVIDYETGTSAISPPTGSAQSPS